MAPPLVGIFVGGHGRRMGGVTKGLLTAPGGTESLASRLLRVARDAYGEVEVVLVGSAEGYASLGLASLTDDPPGLGPIGGLVALLGEGKRRGSPFVVTLACDLPFVNAALLRRLAAFSPAAPCVAPRQGEFWQPLCARFEPLAALEVARSLVEGGARSLQQVVESLSATELPLEASDDLRDWDEPADVARR
jgi:molybdopterin-guanine dinucleotide biosynthesis protein A